MKMKEEEKWLAMALYNAVYGCRVFHKQNQLYDFLNQLNALYQQFPESGIEYVVKAYQKMLIEIQSSLGKTVE